MSRQQGDAIHPTSLLPVLEKQLVPGVILAETSKNQWAIWRLRQQGLESYPIHISSSRPSTSKQYTLFPSLSGILALASAGVALACPDEEDFYIV